MEHKAWYQSLLEFVKSVGKAIAKPSDFFKEANGQLSSTRLMAFEVVNAGLFIAINTTLGDRSPDGNTLALIFGLVTLGLTGKLIQKPMEEKPDSTTPEAPAQ